MKTKNEIKNAFNIAFNGHRNAITPNIIYYGQVGNYLYELSSGRSIFDCTKQFYGLTILQIDENGKHIHRQDLSCSSEDKTELETKIKALNS